MASTSRSNGLVSGKAIARHLTCDDAHIRRLTDAGVIERLPGGFDLDACRDRYVAHLRRARKETPKSEAAAAFAEAKAELMKMRVAREKGETVTCAEADVILEEMVGAVLTSLHGLPARVFPHDLVGRRRLEGYIFEIRSKIGSTATAEAEKL